MNSIFASKLYQASPRKDKIQAALLAPSNLSLVQQLADSLDEEYKTPENLGQESKKPEIEENADFILDEKIDPEKDLMTVDDLDVGTKGSKSSKGSSKSSKPKRRSSGPSPSHFPSPSTLSDDSDVPEPPSDSDTNEKPEEPAEASTAILACEEIDLTVLKDSLNSREDTHGVSRVVEKDREIWIYYKDDVNLNNMMTEVIEYVMNAGYVSLEFNRLARSDNAIVFIIVNGVGEIPVEAGTKVDPVSKSKSIDQKRLDPREARPAKTDWSKALAHIREQKRLNDLNGSKDEIKGFVRKDDTLRVEFKNHEPVTFTEEQIRDGSYKSEINNILM